MNFSDYYQLGHISKTYGLAGEVVLHLDVSDPAYYSNLDIIYILTESQLVPHFISNVRVSFNKARIAIEDISSRDLADSLVGREIYLPIKYLPKLKDDEYYFHELIDFEIFSNDKIIGTVSKIYDLGSQNLFSTLIDGKEVMIPLNPDILKEVDLENRKIVVELPDGLIDIYTGT